MHQLAAPGAVRACVVAGLRPTLGCPYRVLKATALDAEARAKASVLAGPDAAAEWLPNGGVVVLDDRTPQVMDP